jgi:O-succinylbenzoate synthase
VNQKDADTIAQLVAEQLRQGEAKAIRTIVAALGPSLEKLLDAGRAHTKSLNQALAREVRSDRARIATLEAEVAALRARLPGEAE